MVNRITTRILIFLLTLFSFSFSVYGQEVEIQSSGQIKNVKDPVDLQDAATKAYVDNTLMSFGISVGPAGMQGLLDAGYSPLEIINQGADTSDFIGLNYAGGIIFYIKSDGRGLVSATSLQSTGAEWGCFGLYIRGAQGFTIGTGLQNTIDIEAGCIGSGTAAAMCANLIFNGFDDWFLPSKDELNEMYTKIGQGASAPNTNIAKFDDFPYWSSTQYNINAAYYQNFLNSNQGPENKFVPYRVRAIRAF